jgi:hypothetical protein
MMFTDYPDRESWLTARTTPDAFYIGASEIAAVLGLSPFTSPWEVWAKHRAPELLPADKAPELADGLAWEDAAAVLYEHEHRPYAVVERPQFRVCWNAATPWLRATPDAFVYRGYSAEPDSRRIMRLWECKTLRRTQVCTGMEHGVAKWEAVDPDASAWPADGTVIDDYGDLINGPVPVWMWIQCQAQMYTTGAPVVDLEGWFFGFEAPVRRRVAVTYDAARFEVMLAKVEAWRQRHLVDGYPPDTREPWEIMQLARWRWPVKGPKRAATEEEAELIADLLRWKLERKELEEAEKHARAKLAVSMAHHQQVWTVAAVASFNKNNALTVK